jgi:RNA polymerase sigma-70 factor (ECF subfamily)
VLCHLLLIAGYFSLILVAQEKHPTSQMRRISEKDDRILIDEIARRDAHALEQLYERYRTVVYHLAFKVLGNRESAEEVVLEVFWQVWRDAERYDVQRGSIGAWLATIARSRAIDALRARRVVPTVEDDVDDTPLAADPTADPETQVSLGQRAELVRAALENLPADQRIALELAFFNGLSHGEIAEQLQEPLGTVKTRIRSAMLRLRERLRPLLGGKT